MATQRLDPIRIDYQTPSDVAGLAGQRTAQQEFEVISKNQTAKVAEAQSIVSQHLKAQDTFARIGQTQQQIQLDTAKQVHNQRMQNEELNMMKRKLPFELAQMDADLEAQRIDNAYADEDNASRLRGQHLQNRIREEDLGRYKRSQQEIAQAGNWRTNIQNQLNSGVDPDDIDWNAVTGGAPPATKEGREIISGLKEWARETTRGKMNDAANEKGLKALGNLSDAQRETLKGRPNSFDANGVLTDEGRSAAKRFSSTNKMSSRDRTEIEDDLKKSLEPAYNMGDDVSFLLSGKRAPARPPKRPPYKWGEYIDGQFVLTDEGVREVAAREKLRELVYTVESKVVTDEGGVKKTVTTYTPKNKVISDQWEELNKAWRLAHPEMSMSSAQGNAHYDEARRGSGQQVQYKDGEYTVSAGQLDRARANNTELWYVDDNGKYHFVSPATVGASKAPAEEKKPEGTEGDADASYDPLKKDTPMGGNPDLYAARKDVNFQLTSNGMSQEVASHVIEMGMDTNTFKDDWGTDDPLVGLIVQAARRTEKMKQEQHSEIAAAAFSTSWYKADATPEHFTDADIMELAKHLDKPISQWPKGLGHTAKLDRRKLPSVQHYSIESAALLRKHIPLYLKYKRYEAELKSSEGGWHSDAYTGQSREY